MRYTAEKFVPLPPDRAWEVFSDSDRLNRFGGLPRVSASAFDAGVRRTASARFLGLALSWVEHPFEWIEGRRWTITRDYSRGPVRRVAGSVEFAPADAGTRLRFVVEVAP